MWDEKTGSPRGGKDGKNKPDASRGDTVMSQPIHHLFNRSPVDLSSDVGVILLGEVGDHDREE